MFEPLSDEWAAELRSRIQDGAPLCLNDHVLRIADPDDDVPVRRAIVWCGPLAIDDLLLEDGTTPGEINVFAFKTVEQHTRGAAVDLVGDLLAAFYPQDADRAASPAGHRVRTSHIREMLRNAIRLAALAELDGNRAEVRLERAANDARHAAEEVTDEMLRARWGTNIDEVLAGE